MDIKITYRRDADHPQGGGRGGETWTIDASGIEGYDGDRAVKAITDAGVMLKVGAYGNARMVIAGLAGWDDALLRDETPPSGS